MFKDFRNCHDLLRSMWFHHTPTSTVGGWAHHFPKNTTGLQMDQRRKHHGPGFSGPSRIFPASMKSAMSCLPNQNERIQRQSPKLGIGGILDYQMSLQGYVCFFFFRPTSLLPNAGIPMVCESPKKYKPVFFFKQTHNLPSNNHVISDL